MTVREYIDKLLKLPQHLTVVRKGEDQLYQYHTAQGPEEISVLWNERGSDEHEMYYPQEGESVVRTRTVVSLQ